MGTNTSTDLPNCCPFLGWNAQGNLGPFTIYVNRHRRPVWYLTKPQMEPPSYARKHQKDVLRACSLAWNWSTPSTRSAWLLAAVRARLRVSGWNLFVWYFCRRDAPTIRTIERVSHVSLLDPAGNPWP